MFCPNCGNNCDDANFCPNCGQKMISSDSDVPVNVQEPPIGRYEGVDGYMDISYYTLTIHKDIEHKTIETVIDYRNISKIIFSPAEGYSNGYLAVREKAETSPLVHDEWDAVCNEKALVFNKEMNGNIQRAWEYLQQFSLKIGTTDEEEKGCGHNRSAELICCPHCQSSKYFVHEKQRRRVFMSGKSPVLALWMIVLYICEKCFAKRTEYVCLDCGYTWEN